MFALKGLVYTSPFLFVFYSLFYGDGGVPTPPPAAGRGGGGAVPGPGGGVPPTPPVGGPGDLRPLGRRGGGGAPTPRVGNRPTPGRGPMVAIPVTCPSFLS